MNDDTTSRFIASLVKSLQALCHGYVDFEKNIEIIGHIYLNVDSQQKFDYVVNEQVSKTDETSPTTFISNSFHAKPNRKPVRTSRQNDSPLDLKTNSTKDIAGFDLSTFHSESGQGRSASRESSQSLSAGSETGSLSGSAPGRDPNSSTPIQGRNQDHRHVSRRKRHLLNDVSSKLSPNVSPPSRTRDHDQRNSHNSPVSRLQYTLGASASKLAKRISNELERQGQGHPDSDPEIHNRLSDSPAFPTGHLDNSIPGVKNLSENFSRSSEYLTETPHVQNDSTEDSVTEDGVDLTRVKREAVEDNHLFEQLDWSKSNQHTEQDQDDAFPRTGPDDPEACEDPDIKSEDLPDKEVAAASCLYPIMIHPNASQMQLAGYGSPVFPQSFVEPPLSLSAGSSPVASTSGQISPGSTFASRRPRPGGQGQGQGYNAQFTPRSGKVPREMASKYNEDVTVVKAEKPSNETNIDELWTFGHPRSKLRGSSASVPRTKGRQLTVDVPQTSDLYYSSDNSSLRFLETFVNQPMGARSSERHSRLAPNTRNPSDRDLRTAPSAACTVTRGSRPTDGRLVPEVSEFGQEYFGLEELQEGLQERLHTSVGANEEHQTLQCSLCAFNHWKELAMRDHMTKVHLRECHICVPCQLVFSVEKELTTHNKHCHGVGLECDYCGKLFTLKCNLVEHIKRIHEHGVNARHFVCPECSKTFTRPSHLRIHMERHHSQQYVVPDT